MLNVLRAVHEPHIIKRTLGFAAFLLGSQNELVERTGGCGAASGAYCNKWILDEFCALCLGTHALVRDGMVRLMGFSFFTWWGECPLSELWKPLTEWLALWQLFTM